MMKLACKPKKMVHEVNVNLNCNCNTVDAITMMCVTTVVCCGINLVGTAATGLTDIVTTKIQNPKSKRCGLGGSRREDEK